MKKSVVVNVSSHFAECILCGISQTVPVLRRPKLEAPFTCYLWNSGVILGSFVCSEIRPFSKCKGFVMVVNNPKSIEYKLGRDMFPNLKKVLAWSYVEDKEKDA